MLCNVFGGALARKVWAKHFFPTTLVIACKELKTQKQILEPQTVCMGRMETFQASRIRPRNVLSMNTSWTNVITSWTCLGSIRLFYFMLSMHISKHVVYTAGHVTGHDRIKDKFFWKKRTILQKGFCFEQNMVQPEPCFLPIFNQSWSLSVMQQMKPDWEEETCISSPTSS